MTAWSSIAINGQSLDDLPPDADFGAGPVPVTITIDPGAVFTLGDIKLEGDAADLMPAEFGLIPGGDARLRGDPQGRSRDRAPPEGRGAAAG